MVSDQATTPDKNSLDSELLKSTLDRIESDLLSAEISQNTIADYLLKYAHTESWTYASLDEIIHNKLQRNVKNLYIPELLIKANDPNFIFEQIRQKLSVSGYFAFKIVTAENVKARFRERFSPFFFSVYYPVHFISTRIIPKLKYFRYLPKWLSVSVGISKAEILGRLIYKGFEISDLVENDFETIIVAQIDLTVKVSTPRDSPNEGILLRMNRLGQNGKLFLVYKFRSMHPYAEFVQAYLYKKNGLDTGGKFKNDFRVSTGGRIIRKYWIDEIPMLYNLLKGDIKLIGVRPLSEHYFSLYPEDIQALRKKYKPGLLPPFYADMPKTFNEIVQSELLYFSQYDKEPIKTDFHYFLKILKNIVINKARSK